MLKSLCPLTSCQKKRFKLIYNGENALKITFDSVFKMMDASLSMLMCWSS